MNRTPFFRHQRWVDLILSTIGSYSAAFALHDYVVMHDHLHLLLTPNGPLEKSLQLIKGGFSYRAKRELTWPSDIWQRSYSDHRIRDLADYEHHSNYIAKNFDSLGAPDQNHRHPSGNRLPIVAAPQWLTTFTQTSNVAAQAVPLQNRAVSNPAQIQRD